MTYGVDPRLWSSINPKHPPRMPNFAPVYRDNVNRQAILRKLFSIGILDAATMVERRQQYDAVAESVKAKSV
jgi:hypothetical protein